MIFHLYFPMNIHKKEPNMEERDKKILEYIKKEKIITSSELSEKLNVSWNTAEKYLLELALLGKIERIKKTGVNLWILREK